MGTKKTERKKITRRRFIKTGVTTLGGAALCGSGLLLSPLKGYAGNKLKMRMSLSVKRGWPPVEACFRFTDLVREKTNGELDIKAYAGGALGGVDVPGTEGLINGQWEFATCSSTNFSNFTNIYRATELPYIFQNNQEAFKAFDGEPGEIIAKDVEKLGLKNLIFFHYGFRNYYNNVREVHTPADMKGQKVRTSYSPIEIAVIKAQGGNPTPISWAEVITALAQGVVDGTGNADDLIFASKQYEVLKYCTQTRYMYSTFSLLMNKKSFDALPKDMQNILSETSQETVKWQRNLTADKVEEAWAAMNKKGLKKYIPTDEELKLFIKPTKTVWDKYVKPNEAEPELVDKILSLLGRSRKDLFA